MRRLLMVLVLVGCSGSVDSSMQKVWDRHIQKTCNWVQADSEAKKYADRENAARETLRFLQETRSPFVVAMFLNLWGFHWCSEKVDFTSYPWVTVARRRGDCDDFQALWLAVVSEWGGETKPGILQTCSGKMHAFLLWYETPSKVYLFSNQNLLGCGISGEEDVMLRAVYGDDTYGWFTY